mgnify:CR=1 FL=1
MSDRFIAQRIAMARNLLPELKEKLAEAWPQLDVVAEAEDGDAALALFEEHRPDIAFLDIRMPGLSGLDVARAASGRCHTVFTTAYDSHAVAAFDAGAVKDFPDNQAPVVAVDDSVSGFQWDFMDLAPGASLWTGRSIFWCSIWSRSRSVADFNCPQAAMMSSPRGVRIGEA